MSLNSTLLNTNVHPFCISQIVKEAPTKIFAKYSNFVNVFLPDLAFEFPKYTKTKNHTFELINVQQPPYRPIYNLRSIELKTLKTYIEIHLANEFIRLFYSPGGTHIFFDQKSDNFF